jgi:hypothetical protein
MTVDFLVNDLIKIFKSEQEPYEKLSKTYSNYITMVLGMDVANFLKFTRQTMSLNLPLNLEYIPNWKTFTTKYEGLVFDEYGRFRST